jgi:hypothetical protein
MKRASHSQHFGIFRIERLCARNLADIFKRTLGAYEHLRNARKLRTRSPPTTRLPGARMLHTTALFDGSVDDYDRQRHDRNHTEHANLSTNVCIRLVEHFVHFEIA